MSEPEDWVFGYGSLVADHVPRPGSPGSSIWARLDGFRRTWNVAMANADPASDPKHYVDPATGTRPDIHVAFLNVRTSRSESCIGALIPVTDAYLVELDLREVNYRRIEVSRSIRPRPVGRAWLYVGLDAAIERFRHGSATGNAYVAAAYLGAVRSGFRVEPWTYPEFRASTDPLSVPSRELELVLQRR